MLENFDHFFPREPQRLRKMPGTPNAKALPDEKLLLDMLVRLEGLPFEDCYPLQVTFYEKLLQGELLLPVPAGASLRAGLPIVMLENNRGEKGLPLFSSVESMELWVEEEATEYIAMPFTTLCGYALETHADFIIINAAGPYGCEIAFHDFSYLAEGLIPPPVGEQEPGAGKKYGEVMVEKNTPMRLGLCQSLPNGLMERLNHVFEYNRAIIEQVYLFEVAFNEGPLQPALGVRMPDDCEAHWEKDLWPTLQAILQEMLEKRAVINVFLLNQAGKMETHVREITQPIFTGKAGY